MGQTLLVRRSLESDVEAITAIYSHHVLTGTSSFEIDPPDAAEIARRRSDILQRGFPYLAAELEGVLVAYAYASVYRPRAAYRFTVEDSIYVHPAHVGKGIGRILLPKLIAACEEETTARQMVAVIGDINNSASVRLHERFGFTHAGVLRGVGFKFGRWVDTILMQRALNGQTAPSAP